MCHGKTYARPCYGAVTETLYSRYGAVTEAVQRLHIAVTSRVKPTARQWPSTPRLAVFFPTVCHGKKHTHHYSLMGCGSTSACPVDASLGCAATTEDARLGVSFSMGAQHLPSACLNTCRCKATPCTKCKNIRDCIPTLLVDRMCAHARRRLTRT